MEVSESFFLLVIRASNVESSTSAAVRGKMDRCILWATQIAKKVAPKVAALFINERVVLKDGAVPAVLDILQPAFAELTYVLTAARYFKTQESSVSASDIVLLPEMILHARHKDTPGPSLLARLCLSCG